MTGKVKRLVADRGFFFIKGDDDKDYFGHETGLQGGLVVEDLKTGDVLNFSPTESVKGPRAEGITRIETREVAEATTA